MPLYYYKVRDKQGREVQGSREALSEEELIKRLQNEDLLVVFIEREGSARTQKAKTAGIRYHLRVTIDDLILFSRQLATMLDAGITLLRSLNVLSAQIESRALLKATEQIKHDISSGSTFRDAVAKHPKVFSSFWVHVIETGEASGALPVALAQLADYIEADAATRRKVTSALIYPAVLIVMVIVALVVFTVWIVPIFGRFFEGFGASLPLITQWVLNLSHFMRNYFLWLIAATSALAYLAYRYVNTEEGRWQFDQLKLRIPLLASLFQRIAIERFASGLGTLIESGVPILYGLDIMSKAVGNKIVEKAILEVRESVREGKGMAQPLQRSAVFTPMVVQMVAVGEEIGELGKMLKSISQFYKERIATTLTRLTTLVEPVVLVFMGIVVGVLVLAMFLPIFKLSQFGEGM